MRPIALALLLVPALPLAAESLPFPPPPPEPAAPSAPARSGLPRLGVTLDAGLPDGAALALVYRLPWRSFRASGGASWTGIGWGVQAGLGWTPLRWIVTPSLNLEAGHTFDGDLTWLADRASGIPDGVRPLLRRIGYDVVSAQLGLELGSPRGFSMFVRAGLSYFDLRLHGTGSATSGSGSSEATFSVTDPRLRATTPSAKLGVLWWF